MDLAFLCGAKYGENIYFSGINTNALFLFDCRTHEVKFVAAFEKETARWLNHRMALISEDSIWFVPWEGKYLARFRVSSSKIEFFELPVKGNYAFWEAVTYGDGMLYLIPSGRETNSLIRIDMETSEVEDLGNVLPEGGAVWCIGTYLQDGKIHFISTDGNVCAAYDINLKRSEIFGTSHSGVYQSLVKGDDICFLIPIRNGEGMAKDYNQKAHRSYYLNESLYNGVFFEKKLSLFPFGKSREIAQIPICGNDGKVVYKKIKLKRDLSDRLHMSAVASTCKECWVTTSFGELLRLDDDLNVKERYCLSLDEKETERLKSNPYVNNATKALFMNVVFEDTGYPNLQTLVDALLE